MLNRLMKLLDWSVPVGRLLGVPIRLHITLLFFLVPAFTGLAFSFWISVEYAVAIVLSILLHEFGHALTAKHYRLRDISIMLHGFGGFAMSTGPRSPRQSLLITLAGPAVTFVLGGLCLAIGTFGLRVAPPFTPAFNQFLLIEDVGKLNILMGFLNMLPSLPFDGGQALRAILWGRTSERKAHRAVAHLGLVLTPIIFIVGLVLSSTFTQIFALMGLVTSFLALRESGGVNFKEVGNDRRNAKADEEARQRSKAKQEAYVGNVHARQTEREERERLRKLFEVVSDDEPLA